MESGVLLSYLRMLWWLGKLNTVNIVLGSCIIHSSGMQIPHTMLSKNTLLRLARLFSNIHWPEDGRELPAWTSVASRRCRWRWQQDVRTVACRRTQIFRWRWVRVSDDWCRPAEASHVSASRSLPRTGSWCARRTESRQRCLTSQQSCFPDWQARILERRATVGLFRTSLTE